MRRVVGSWFMSSPRRCGRDRQSTRVNGQESGSLIAESSRRISLYWFFRLPPPLTVFFLSRTAARASSVRVWESLAHVSTSVRTNDRAAAAVATDSLHRIATYSAPRPSVRRPFTHSSGERARETPGAPLRPTITSVTSRPADDRLAPEPPPDPTNAVNVDDDDRLPTTGPDHARWPGGVRFALPRRGVARAVRAIRYAPSVGLRARPSSTTWTTIYSIRSDASENRPCILYYCCHILISDFSRAVASVVSPV